MTKLQRDTRLIQWAAEHPAHSENIKNLIYAFKEGRIGINEDKRMKSAALRFAWLAGKNYLNPKNALTLWQNARFCQGKTAKPLF